MRLYVMCGNLMVNVDQQHDLMVNVDQQHNFPTQTQKTSNARITVTL
jgi:hypothetical protein